MLQRIMGKSVNSTNADPSQPKAKSKSKSKRQDPPVHSAESLRPPRPDAPRSTPRASALTQSQLERSLQAGASQTSRWNEMPTEMQLEVVKHLPLSAQATFSKVSRDTQDLLPVARQDHRQFNTLIKNLGDELHNSEFKYTLRAMALLEGGLHPDDSAKLMHNLLWNMNLQLSQLKLRNNQPQVIKEVFKKAIVLLKTVENPNDKMRLAQAISQKLPVLADFPGSSITHSVPYQLRDTVGRADTTRLTREGAQHMASTLVDLNRHGIEHVPEQHRQDAFDFHIMAMKNLHAVNPPLTAAQNPLPTALHLAASFAPQSKARALYNLNKLNHWKT